MFLNFRKEWNQCNCPKCWRGHSPARGSQHRQSTEVSDFAAIWRFVVLILLLNYVQHKKVGRPIINLSVILKTTIDYISLFSSSQLSKQNIISLSKLDIFLNYRNISILCCICFFDCLKVLLIVSECYQYTVQAQ